MHIGGVAKKIGLTPDTIRFYERTALLPRPSRTVGGFRQYADTDVDTLRFIRQAQGLGFTLKEVRELLALRGSRLQPCAPVHLRLQTKLLQVRRKLRDLRTLQHELRAALRTCKKELRRQNSRCPLLSGKQNRSETAA
jgi:MerR family copper efflux transcriptional regulator